MLPEETIYAISWALNQKVNNSGTGEEIQISLDDPILFVNKVREYFNTNSIEYSTFSYEDLKPFLS